MFDQKEAIKLLEQDRKEYVLKCISYVQGFIDRGMDELAADTIIHAATGLQRLAGGIQYLQAIDDDNYPRFGTLLE